MRPRRKPSRSERFVIAPVKVHLPSLQSTTGIDDLPSGAAKNRINCVVESGQLGAIGKTMPAFPGGCGRGRDKDARASPEGMRRKTRRACAVVRDSIQDLDPPSEGSEC